MFSYKMPYLRGIGQPSKSSYGIPVSSNYRQNVYKIKQLVRAISGIQFRPLLIDLPPDKGKPYRYFGDCCAGEIDTTSLATFHAIHAPSRAQGFKREALQSPAISQPVPRVSEIPCIHSPDGKVRPLGPLSGIANSASKRWISELFFNH